MSDEKMQADFEAWYVLEIDTDADFAFFQDTRFYDDEHIQMAWLGWQASAAHSAASIAELEGQVAILADVLKRLPTRFDVGMPAYRIEVNAILGKIEKTAEEYRRRVQAETLEYAAARADSNNAPPWVAHELRRMASELRNPAGQAEGKNNHE